MRQAFLRFTIALFILLMSTLATSARAGESDPFPSITLPVHAMAINPENKNNAPFKGAKATVYTIKMPFPAKELTTFYDSQLQKMGYERYSEQSSGTFEWMNFNYKSGEWEKTATIPARYTAAWVDHKKTTKIWLYIAYKQDGVNAEWSYTPLVSINLSTFSDSKNTK